MDEQVKNGGAADVGATHASPLRQTPLRNLPAGWRWVRLGEVMPDNVASVDPSAFPDEVFSLFSIPAYDAGQPESLPGRSVGSNKQAVLPGDVLLSKIVPHIRRTWVVGNQTGHRMIASTEWIVFRASDIDPHFLRFRLNEDVFHQQFMATASGVGGSLLRARPALVARVPIPLPPLSEQKRIVAILTEQMAAVEKARAAAEARLEAAKALPAALLRRVFPQGPAPGPAQPVRDTTVGATHASPLQPLPAGWRWVRLGEVCRAIRGITFPKGAARSQPFDGSVPCLTTSGVQEEIEWDTAQFVPVQFVRDADQFLYKGDMLVSTANSKPLVGKLARVRDVPGNVTFGAFTTVVRPLEAAEPEFLFRLLRTERARSYFFTKSSETTNISNLRTEDMLALPIPLPPLSEQKRIVAILTEQMAAAERVRAAAEAELATIEALPAALLRRAFNGEL
ncbi:MAG: Type-1 restriction enzyme EcoKI specificity protein [Candidatus Latescibacteria bacterium ADurb.Bin168]|nr:MAG: Type-1 restriction enzyme EcoKI specificity protein [Candidatus Latescibacteria bacterium ADurb.Bin168]